MRILHVISSTNPMGGGPIEVIKQINASMINLGVDSEVVCCDSPNSSWLSSAELKINSLGPSITNYRYSPRLLPWLHNNMHSFDAVLIHGIWQYHSFAAHKALTGYKIPYFVMPHGMLSPWFKYSYPLKHLKKWLYWPWGDYRVLRDANAVIFSCEEEKNLAKKSFWLYQSRSKVSGLGVSYPVLNAPSAEKDFLNIYPDLLNKRIILFVGRIAEVKGCDLLIHAFKKVSHIDQRLHLLMVGPDQNILSNNLKKLAISLGIKNKITWTGMLEGDIKWAAFHLAEVFCLPSHHENFGVVVAESLACSKPVLITNKVNIWQEIQADGAGFVSEDNIDGIENSLKKWLTLSSEQKKDMAKKALNCFEKNFKIETVVDRLLKIICEDK